MTVTNVNLTSLPFAVIRISIYRAAANMSTITIFIKNLINFLSELTHCSSQETWYHAHASRTTLTFKSSSFFADRSANADDAVEAFEEDQEIDVNLKKIEETNEKNEKKKKRILKMSEIQ